MRVLRILGYISLCLVLLVVISVYSCTKSIEKWAEAPPGQTYSIIGNKVVINSTLTPNLAIVLDGMTWCNDQEISAITRSTEKQHMNFSRSSWCDNNHCNTSITFPSSDIPETIDLFQKSSPTAVCEKKVLGTKENLKIIGYTGTIGISGELKDFFSKQLDKSGFKKHPDSKFNGNSLLNFNGNVRISLDYNTKDPSDLIIYNGKDVQIIYDKGLSEQSKGFSN